MGDEKPCLRYGAARFRTLVHQPTEHYADTLPHELFSPIFTCYHQIPCRVSPSVQLSLDQTVLISLPAFYVPYSCPGMLVAYWPCNGVLHTFM